MRSVFCGFLLLVTATATFAQTPAVAPRLEWSAGPALTQGRDHHATFMVNAAGRDFLYVAGGTNYKELFDDVVRARINADGTLAAWEAAGAYPQKLGGTSVAVADSFVVLTGGQIAQDGNMRALKRIADTYVARIQPDGRLGAWTAAPPLPAARFHHPALHHKGWIYVVGGQGEKEAEAGIFAAKLNPDGTITEWTNARALPRARSHHAAFVYENNLYVVGGLDGAVQGHGAIFVDVIRAPIAEDGSIGDWRIVSRMPYSYATHAAFGHDGYLWVLGGVEDNNRFVDNIWRASVGADGRIGSWEAVKPGLPVARGHVHNTPVLRGFVYTVGGRMLPTSAAEPFLVNAAAHVGRFIR
jgi:hypothetical protein